MELLLGRWGDTCQRKEVAGESKGCGGVWVRSASFWVVRGVITSAGSRQGRGEGRGRV